MENNNTFQDKTEEELVDERLKNQRRSVIVKRLIILAVIFVIGVGLFIFIYTDPQNVLNRKIDAYLDWRLKTENLLSKKSIDFYNNLFYEHDFDKCSELVIPGRQDELAKIFEVEDGYINLDKDSLEFEIVSFDDHCTYKTYKNDRHAEIGVNVWLNNDNIESDEEWPITLYVSFLRVDNKWLIQRYDVLHFYEEDGTQKVCHKWTNYYRD